MEIIGGGTPKTGIKEYWNGNIPWLSIKDFGTSSKIVYVTEKTITERGLKESSTKMLEKGDLIISARGTVGEIAQLGKKMAFNQSCYGLKTKKETTNNFLYYLLKNIILSLKNNVHGSVFDTITKDTFSKIEIDLPPLLEQKKIASILSALDDKIEVNNEMNKTLEEMAQTLFKRWFIDFDFPNENGEPYKSSGGKMVDSELGEIPERWRVGSLEEIVDISSGKRPKIKKEKDKLHKIPIIGANGIMSYTNEFLYNEKLLTIGRVGTLGVVQKYYDKIWTSDNSLVIKSDYLELVYFILKSVDYKSLNRGSTQPLITQTDMKNLKIIIGETELILEFCKIIFKSFNLQKENQQQTQSLTKIRDTLLPKLMSGEVEV